MIEGVLKDTEGNVTQGAKRLGISRKSLQTKMKEFGLRSNSELNDSKSDEAAVVSLHRAAARLFCTVETLRNGVFT